MSTLSLNIYLLYQFKIKVNEELLKKKKKKKEEFFIVKNFLNSGILASKLKYPSFELPIVSLAFLLKFFY